MTEVDRTPDSVDGRVARRQRNVDAVLDVVLEMFAEEAMFPTIDQVANRSGLSLRSLYRYFADPGDLREAAIKRAGEIGRQLSRLPAVGDGPLDRRIDDFVAMRLRLHTAMAPVLRATVANAAHHARVRDQLDQDRDDMRRQFELQFTTELAEREAADRDAVVTAGDLLTQLESIDYLRRLSVAEAHAAIAASLHAILGSSTR